MSGEDLGNVWRNQECFAWEKETSGDYDNFQTFKGLYVESGKDKVEELRPQVEVGLGWENGNWTFLSFHG